VAAGAKVSPRVALRNAFSYSFRRIGKKSPAHKGAIDTLRRKVEPDREIDLEELLEQL
jgi:hypothetical protein